MNDIEFKTQLGDLLDAIAGDAYEGWDDYWTDRNAELEGLLMRFEDWRKMAVSKAEKKEVE